jgi:hypothetical protein
MDQGFDSMTAWVGKWSDGEESADGVRMMAALMTFRPWGGKMQSIFEPMADLVNMSNRQLREGRIIWQH